MGFGFESSVRGVTCDYEIVTSEPTMFWSVADEPEPPLTPSERELRLG